MVPPKDIVRKINNIKCLDIIIVSGIPFFPLSIHHKLGRESNHCLPLTYTWIFLRKAEVVEVLIPCMGMYLPLKTGKQW